MCESKTEHPLCTKHRDEKGFLSHSSLGKHLSHDLRPDWAYFLRASPLPNSSTSGPQLTRTLGKGKHQNYSPRNINVDTNFFSQSGILSGDHT